MTEPCISAALVERVSHAVTRGHLASLDAADLAYGGAWYALQTTEDDRAERDAAVDAIRAELRRRFK